MAPYFMKTIDFGGKMMAPYINNGAIVIFPPKWCSINRTKVYKQVSKISFFFYYPITEKLATLLTVVARPTHGIIITHNIDQHKNN